MLSHRKLFENQNSGKIRKKRIQIFLNIDQGHMRGWLRRKKNSKLSMLVYAMRTHCTQFSKKIRKSEILICHHWNDGWVITKTTQASSPWPIFTSIHPVRYSNRYRRLRVPVKSLLSATLLLSSYLAMHTRDVWFGQFYHNTLRMCSSKEQEFMELLNLIQHTFIFISLTSGPAGVLDPDPMYGS